tara:strand:- start:351 stop:1004 length:654 start_codon:yes stop_codon:yes gene_type:complete
MRTKELIVPSRLDEVTLSTWQEILRLGETASNETLVALLCDITPQQVLELPNNVYDQAVVLIAHLVDKAKGEHELIMRFELNGVEYGMIPNLDDISYGENKDLVAFLGDWKDMHKAMSVLFRPITKSAKDTYQIEPYDGLLSHKEEILNMPISIVLAAQVFFYNLTKELLRCIPSYLERVMQKEMSQGVPSHLTKQAGEDMMKAIVSLKGTFEDLMR